MFFKVIKFYNEAKNSSDPLVEKWFLMNSIWLPISITIFYLYFVLFLGPKLMKNRSAFDINRVIKIYNVVQVIFNAYLLKRCCEYIYRNIDSFGCLRFEHFDTLNGYEQRLGSWMFTLNKLLDLLDTVFFVLKKKQSHISFLHVYHHAITFTVVWALTKYYPGGQIIILGALNSFVHCSMYSYYLISISDRFKKTSNFIKKHITQMQIAQFILGGIYILFGKGDASCNYPPALFYFGWSQGFLFVYLFGNFYRKTYFKSPEVDQRIQNGYIKNNIFKKAS